MSDLGFIDVKSADDDATNPRKIAQLQSLSSGTTQFTDHFGSNDLYDNFAFSLGTPSNLAMRLSWYDTNTVFFKIFDQNGDLVKAAWSRDLRDTSNDPGRDFGNTSMKISEQLQAGTYTLQVMGMTDSDYQFRFSNSPITQTPSTPVTSPVTPPTTTPTPIPVTPAADSDGTLATAYPLNSLTVGDDTSVTTKIGGGDDNDYYKFSLDAPSNFAARLSYASTNPLLHIYQADGTEITNAGDPNTPPPADSVTIYPYSTKFTANLVAGEYYARVDANNSTGTDYGLRLSNTPITTQTPTTPVTTPPTTTPVTPPTTTPVPVTPTPVDTTSPKLVDLLPSNGAMNTNVDTNIYVTFNEPVKAGQGNIEIYNLTMDTSKPGRIINVNDTTQVTFLSTNQMQIHPTKVLTGGSKIEIRLYPGVVKDIAGNSYASESQFSFTTDGLNPLQSYATAAVTNPELVTNPDKYIQYTDLVNTGTIPQDAIYASNNVAAPVTDEEYVRNTLMNFGRTNITPYDMNYWLGVLKTEGGQGEKFRARFVKEFEEYSADKDTISSPEAKQDAVMAKNKTTTAGDEIKATLTKAVNTANEIKTTVEAIPIYKTVKTAQEIKDTFKAIYGDVTNIGGAATLLFQELDGLKGVITTVQKQLTVPISGMSENFLGIDQKYVEPANYSNRSFVKTTIDEVTSKNSLLAFSLGLEQVVSVIDAANTVKDGVNAAIKSAFTKILDGKQIANDALEAGFLKVTKALNDVSFLLNLSDGKVKYLTESVVKLASKNFLKTDDYVDQAFNEYDYSKLPATNHNRAITDDFQYLTEGFTTLFNNYINDAYSNNNHTITASTPLTANQLYNQPLYTTKNQP